PVFGYPLVHDLGVAQLAELAEELFRQAAHFVPGRIGIDFSHDRRDGAAAPDSHTQVVDGVLILRGLQSVQFLRNPLHPMSQTPMLREVPGNGGSGGHVCLLNRPAPPWEAAPTERNLQAYPCVLAESSGAVENSSSCHQSLPRTVALVEHGRHPERD